MNLELHGTSAAGLGARPPSAAGMRNGGSSGGAGARRTTRCESSLAHVSHELKTPIHTVLGYATLLSDGVGGALPPQAAEMVGRITRSAQHLLHLAEDLLDLARLDAGRVRLSLDIER